jgi:hypothetical protein
MPCFQDGEDTLTQYEGSMVEKVGAAQDGLPRSEDSFDSSADSGPYQ